MVIIDLSRLKKLVTKMTIGIKSFAADLLLSQNISVKYVP